MSDYETDQQLPLFDNPAKAKEPKLARDSDPDTSHEAAPDPTKRQLLRALSLVEHHLLHSSFGLFIEVTEGAG